MSKQPYCIVGKHTPGVGICCTIRGAEYQYLAAHKQFYIMMAGEWVELSPSEIAAKQLICQTLQDRYASAEKRHADQVAHSHHIAESRRVRMDRGRRNYYKSGFIGG